MLGERHNVMPISGRAGTTPALEQKEAYPPALSTALAGYFIGRLAAFHAATALSIALRISGI